MYRNIHSPQGFTLIEMLVVVAIIGLLSSIILPIIINAMRTSEDISDSVHLKQVMNMYLTNRTDHRQTWAFPRGNDNIKPGTTTQPQINGSDCDPTGVDVTNISLYTLAARYELNPDLFNTQAGGKVIEGIANAKREDESAWTTDTIRAWTSINAGSITSTDLPYAVDWSAPKTSGTARITMAMRDRYAYEDIPVVFADGHSGTVSIEPNTQAVVNIAVTPLDAVGNAKNGLVADDIYSSIGDIPPPAAGGPALPRHLWLGRGDKIRTHVK